MKIRVLSLFTALLVFVSLIGCNGNKADLTEKIKTEYKPDKSFDSAVKETETYTVAQNQNYIMHMNTKTGAVTVKDKKTGVIWNTNPDTDKKSRSEIASYQSVADSQIVITFLDSSNKNQQKIWDSATECIEKNQYSFYPIKNGIGVSYFFGEVPQMILVPELMSKEHFEKLYNKMDEYNRSMLQIYYELVSLDMYSGEDTTKAYMEETYPILKSQDVYVLQTGSVSYSKLDKSILKMVEENLISGGYSEADYKSDVELSKKDDETQKKLQISLALEYVLTDDGFTATVPKDSISYDVDALTMTDLAVLPSFESVDSEEEADFFVPDGCGALIKTNNGKCKGIKYRQRVYGEDEIMLVSEKEEPHNSEICIPVFGIMRKNSSFLAEITSGDAYAYLNASVSGEGTKYNRNYASFLPRAYCIQQSNAKSEIRYITTDFKISSDLSVSYSLIPNKSDYSDLALFYKQKLIDSGRLKKKNTSKNELEVQLIGSVNMNCNVLGIPYMASKSVTSYDECLSILNKLDSEGQYNISPILLSWCNDGDNNSVMTSVKPIKSLGSKKELTNLCKEKQMYLGANFFTAEKTVSSRRLSSEDINGLKASTFDFFIKEKDDNYIVSPMNYSEIINKFIKKNSYSKNIYDRFSANRLGCDYNEDKPSDRETSKFKTRQMLSALKDNGYSIKLKGANQYVWEYADSLSEVPLTSSNRYIFDGDVPFLQLVLSGYINYSGQPLNLTDNYEISVLKAIETGAEFSFSLMNAENTVLNNSTENLYSVNFDMWYKDALELCKMAKEYNSLTDKSSIKSHKTYGKTCVTEYGNGIKTYVNYSEKPVKIDGVSLKAKGYSIQKTNTERE